jgi:hypothetical protein
MVANTVTLGGSALVWELPSSSAQRNSTFSVRSVNSQ